MTNLEWFTGNEMSAAEVAEMSLTEIEAGIRQIGVDETINVKELARQIKAEAEDNS